MLVKFKSETFSWLRENATNKHKSIAAFIEEIVEDRKNSPQQGENNGQETTRSTE